MKTTWILGLMATVLLVACEESAPTPAPSAASAKPVAAASAKPAATPAATAASNEELPTIEDFEEAANSQITAANLEKELEALEKEINAAE